VVHLAVIGLFVTDEVEEGDKGLTTHFVDEFGLPEQHDVALHFNCFFDFGSKEFSCLFLFNYKYEKVRLKSSDIVGYYLCKSHRRRHHQAS